MILMIPCPSCTGVLVPFVQVRIVWLFLAVQTEGTEQIEPFWVVDVVIERVCEEEEEDDERYSGCPEFEESRETGLQSS
jgi:hypothetical protein